MAEVAVIVVVGATAWGMKFLGCWKSFKARKTIVKAPRSGDSTCGVSRVFFNNKKDPPVWVILTVGGSKVTASRMCRERTEWCRRVRRVRDGARHTLV